MPGCGGGPSARAREKWRWGEVYIDELHGVCEALLRGEARWEGSRRKPEEFIVGYEKQRGDNAWPMYCLRSFFGFVLLCPLRLQLDLLLLIYPETSDGIKTLVFFIFECNVYMLFVDLFKFPFLERKSENIAGAILTLCWNKMIVLKEPVSCLMQLSFIEL